MVCGVTSGKDALSRATLTSLSLIARRQPGRALPAGGKAWSAWLPAFADAGLPGVSVVVTGVIDQADQGHQGGTCGCGDQDRFHWFMLDVAHRVLGRVLCLDA